MQVEYITHMGSDAMVVDAARVSFDKASTNYTDEENEKLINYLAKHNHWSPFSHPQIQVRVTAPIFIANQLKRSVVGLSINEVSRRYVDDLPMCYCPKEWRSRPDKSIKQGSGELLQDQVLADRAYITALVNAKNSYEKLLSLGVAPEMARIVLPQSMYTSWIWTGSLLAFIRIYKQRIDPHAQLECQMVARQLGDILKTYFPVSFKAWVGE